MSSSAPSPAAVPAKPILACIRCAERKIKCDKRSPCSSCTRHNAQCIFRAPQLLRRKRRIVSESLLHERLKRYEALLQDNGIDPHQATPSELEYHSQSQSEEPETSWHMPKPISIVSGPQATIFQPRLLHGQKGTNLVDNNLWSRVAEEIHDGEDPEEDPASDISDGEASNDDFVYVLGWKTPTSASWHPPADLIRKLWGTFLENVNPLLKLVHVPSLQPAIERAIADIEHVPRGFEALMFAIYTMAVLSLTEEESKEMFGEDRANLLSRYVAATKTALSRAKFMSNTSIVVLQALVLHIISIRDANEPRAVWSLTGVAIRVAEGMGMGLNGTLLGLSPFETEIRRRIWWQLRMHDFRAAELSGQSKFRDFEIDDTTPKKPANVNDSDLYPAMPHFAAESIRPTEMIWCTFRSDLATFAATQKIRMQRLGKAIFTSEEFSAMDDLKVKDGFIKELEDMIETKYVRFCDPSQPLQLLTLLGARLSTNLIRFIAHHPRRWTSLDQVPAAEQKFVWETVILLLEQYNMMQASPQLRRFAWNVPYFIQWHAVIHVLDTLRADPLHHDASKAWRLIDALYSNNSDVLWRTNKPICVAVGNLCLKAFSARAAALTKEKNTHLEPPEYIRKLQEQREAAKVRRDIASKRCKDQEPLNDDKRIAATDADTDWSDTKPSSAEVMIEAQLHQQSVAKRPGNLGQGNTRSGDDAFWLSETLNDDFFAAGAADMMNLDTDTIMAQDYWPDAPNGEVIDWAQWDTWLGKADPTRPNLAAGPG